MRGKLIAIEGLDGCGKETQTNLLCDSLKNIGMKCHHVTFPDYKSDSSTLVKMYLDGKFGSQPSDVNSYAASSFFAVDRFASFRTSWKKYYDAGDLIVSDRYTFSNLIFQLPKQKKENWNSFCEWVFDFEFNKMGIPKPDITIYLDVPVEVSEQLLLNRYNGNELKKDIHEKNIDFERKCRDAADFSCNKFSWIRINCVKNNTLRSIDDIHNEVMSCVKEML